MRIAICALAALLAGCVSSDTVYLRNMSGEIAKCGPYSVPYTVYAPISVQTLDNQLRGCVEDYRRQGYERVAMP